MSRGLMPIRVLLSAVGFTFSLVFATQGCVQTFSDGRRAVVALRRCTYILPELPEMMSETWMQPSAALCTANNRAGLTAQTGKKTAAFSALCQSCRLLYLHSSSRQLVGVKLLLHCFT